VIQQAAAGAEERVEGLEVPVLAGPTHVLEHADARDGVEPVRLVGQLPVVLQADLHSTGQSGVGHPLASQLPLGAGDRDPQPLDLVLGGGMEEHAAPATTDVEEAHPGTESELAADQVVLGLLGGLEAVVEAFEPGARVRHRLAEHQAVEVVADVVVVADRRRVSPERVPDSDGQHLLGRRRRRRAEGAEAVGGA
jgi:hypothetical protein